MPKKTTDGFDLLIGPYYSDGYYRDTEPSLSGECEKCGELTTKFSLYKTIYAFGLTIKKQITILTCTNCYHEVLITTAKPKKPKSRRSALHTKFMSLPPEKQLEILKLAGGKL